MIRRSVILSCLIATTLSYGNAQEWKPAGDKILTEWATKVDPKQPHPEYPRPQLVRSNNWQNLNGLWKYAVTDKSVSQIPTNWDGNILVPYAIESALSGVGRSLNKDQALWYTTDIVLSKKLKNEKTILHFDAVDWQCEVLVNGQSVAKHEGGFNSFSVDISQALKKGNKQQIVVRVWDPTSDGPQPRGKQINKPHSIWYTPVSGIWQTVWLESVPKSYIKSTHQTPQVDQSSLTFSADIEAAQAGDLLHIIAYDNGKKIAESSNAPSETQQLKLENISLWSPSNPKLYDLEVMLMRKGKVIDQAKSYFAMRKISKKADQKGIERMYLNDEFLFHYGPLDQGWWPDGLHTAPTDEALKFDIEKTKEMGFNMIRKHIKVEPARWYRHCDSIGILVWQDMPSGDLGGNNWDMHPGKFRAGKQDKDRTPESEAIFKKEWNSIMTQLHNFPSIVVWVPFNEAWGQFKTKEIVEWTKQKDPSRLVNGASGGNYLAPGDILDLHNYPEPAMPDPARFGKDFILANGEFGGLGLPIEGHTWQAKDNWGYQSFKSVAELKKRYSELITDLTKLLQLGLSAAVYTQTTDVEIETNGLMTYDRKVIKIPTAELREINEKLYDKSLIN